MAVLHKQVSGRFVGIFKRKFEVAATAGIGTNQL